MAEYFDGRRREVLAKVHGALDALAVDLLRLDRDGQRFSHAPPPYISTLSGTTVLSTSSDPLSGEQPLRQLGDGHDASLPRKQFSHQLTEEENRLFEAELDVTRRLPAGSDICQIAYETVKGDWVAQGIWNNKWNKTASGRWKHEEPLELESESESDQEAGSSPPPFSFPAEKPPPRPRVPKSDEEKRRIAERLAVREREREASRPCHQFFHQISKEREQIQDQGSSEGGTDLDTPDINTVAYWNIKIAWIEQGL